MPGPRFSYFALYHHDRRDLVVHDRYRRSHWYTRDLQQAIAVADKLGCVVIPVAIWEDHRAEIRACKTNLDVADFIAARTGWRAS